MEGFRLGIPAQHVEHRRERHQTAGPPLAVARPFGMLPDEGFVCGDLGTVGGDGLLGEPVLDGFGQCPGRVVAA